MAINGEKYEFELWRKGAGKSLLDIYNTIKQLSEFITQCFDPLVFCDLKWFLNTISVGNLFGKVDHYDLLIPPIESTGDPTTDSKILNTLHASLSKTHIKPWMQYVANSQHAYRAIETGGLLWNCTRVKPVWDYYTYSGRSRCTGFNIQGHSEPDLIVRYGLPSEALLLHFDWSCADLRVLGLLSNDDVLLSTFEDSDPYTVVSKVLDIDRNEAKTAVLRSIYSLDLDGFMHAIFPTACDWLKSNVNDAETLGYTRNSFGRIFMVSGERTVKSAVNAVLQGTIATLAQVVVNKIHTMFPEYLVTDTFDGIVLSIPKDQNILRSTIQATVDIMRDPFGDLSFPMKASTNIGVRWGQWQEVPI